MIGVVGFIVLIVFVVLLVATAAMETRDPAVFRPMPGLDALRQAVGRAVEAGQRVHLSLGTGTAIGSDSAPAYAGLAALKQVALMTSTSDKPVVATTGSGALALLAQDTLRTAYSEANAEDRFEMISGRLLGPTPFSYVATLPTLIDTEDVSVHLMSGSFGVEAALAADIGTTRTQLVLAGTDDVQSQAVIFPTAQYPLIGEEVFAMGAYLGAGTMHTASLRTQDVVRWLVIGAILLGTILRTLGVGG